MSDSREGESSTEKPFYVDRAKTGRSGCKKCKQKICQGELRFGKLGYNPFGSGTRKQWYHVPCMFEMFKKQRATSKKIENPDEIGGWEDLTQEEKEEIMSYFSDDLKKVFETFSLKRSPIKNIQTNTNDVGAKFEHHKDNSFRAFRKLCANLSNNSSYLRKTKIVADFFEEGSDGDYFKGDVELWCKLLLPGAVPRVYNLRSKQLIKLFSRILGEDHEEMLEDLEKGDVADTISNFFKMSNIIRPADKSVLTLKEVDEFLEELSKMTKEEEQMYHFKKIMKKCTANDLKMIIRLINHDLRINAGPKHILEALNKDAYKAFQASRDLKMVVTNALKGQDNVFQTSKKEKRNHNMILTVNMMIPVLPMLAQPCKSFDVAFKRCPNGMFSEIKYDGERVQVHKKGNTVKYFSRSLKPVTAHKVKHLKNYISQAFPHGNDLILDAEILLVDSLTGKPLPFGTLGVHKKGAFKNANICLFVFDCLYYNGKSLLNAVIKERKDILHENMIEVKNHIMLSEMKEVHKMEELEKMMTQIFKLGLEGLVLKDLKSTYEPGKRHWLKVKKNYLFGGAMADAADLVVLGAWLGTGSKGGKMSSFLMGCFNPEVDKWVTVAKVSNGHDDSTLERIQNELDVVKIPKDASKVPSWLNCTKTMIPDLIAVDPKKMPVWEITGAEFTCNQLHTADGISIRFPTVTKIRSDKDWSNATNLEELKELYAKSKDNSDFSFENIKKCSSSKGVSSDTEEEEEEEEEEEREQLRHQTTKDIKRKNTDNFNGESSKKIKLGDHDHLAYHTDTDSDTDTEEELGIDQDDEDMKEEDLINPLPNIFTDCNIQMPKDYKNYDFLRRYLIAYGAVLYDPTKKTSVENSTYDITHVTHLKQQVDKRAIKYQSKNVKHVHINWLWDSIKLLEKQPEHKYTVTVVD